MANDHVVHLRPLTDTLSLPGAHSVPALRVEHGPPVSLYTPAEIAKRIEVWSVAKTRLTTPCLLALGFLGGLFIAFGAAFATLAMTGTGSGFGPSRLVAGVAFSLGLILVINGGAELSTGNNLLAMAWASGKVSTADLCRNWGFSFAANASGCLLLALLVAGSGLLDAGGIGDTARRIAEAKLALPAHQAFIRGILCNALVCLAVWTSFAATTPAGKTLAVVFPISAFVALGFEHSIANVYLIPVGIMAGASGSIIGLLANLVPVTLGNLVGGSLVALVFWYIHLRAVDPRST